MFSLDLYQPPAPIATPQQNNLAKILRSGQTEAQVNGLRSTKACVHLHWLAFTLVEIKFARKSTQVFFSFGHPTKVNVILVVFFK